MLKKTVLLLAMWASVGGASTLSHECSMILTGWDLEHVDSFLATEIHDLLQHFDVVRLRLYWREPTKAGPINSLRLPIVEPGSHLFVIAIGSPKGAEHDRIIWNGGGVYSLSQDSLASSIQVDDLGLIEAYRDLALLNIYTALSMAPFARTADISILIKLDPRDSERLWTVKRAAFFNLRDLWKTVESPGQLTAEQLQKALGPLYVNAYFQDSQLRLREARLRGIKNGQPGLPEDFSRDQFVVTFRYEVPDSSRWANTP